MSRRAHYVLSTHWDREWYLPFQAFRARLVALLDELLAGLADGRLPGPFTCDGQAILLEDYLEVRPERRAEVEALARAGRLVVGPWYAIPDEFLVSGESLVRNLRLGRQVARALGARPSGAGWLCDQFGHISQMPQIFAGFGIQGAFLWRGVNETGSRHFRWVGADGTALPTYRFGDVGYCSFAFRVRRADRPDLALDEEQLWENLEQFLAEEAAATAPPPILLLDGADHLAWDPAVSRALAGYAAQAEPPFAIVHSSLDAYLAELLPHAGAIAAEIRGELREPARMPLAEDRHWLIPGVLSSRPWIKQENAACESLLTQWAEPLSAWATAALGRPYPQGFLDLAWRWLLQNHPHDSMSGCSVDAVHEEMRYRFAQARQIAEIQADGAARAIALAAGGPIGADELRVTVFNPLPRPLDETAELTLELPADWPAFGEFFGFEALPAFRIFGPDGAELPYQRLGQRMGRSRARLSPHKFPDTYRVNEVRVSLPLRLPALGYAGLTVRPGQLDALPPHPSIRPGARPTRHPGRGLATSERAMRNELLAVTVEPDGSLTLEDLRTGAVYRRLLSFEDGADIGDGWYHGPPLADERYVAGPANAGLALVHDGPQLTTFRLRGLLRVPAAFDFARMARGAEMVDITIESLISLRPGADRLEVETSLVNTAADHRLRLLLPSGAAATSYLADGAFDAVERPIALRADNYAYRELEVEGKPQQSWTAVWGGGRGLALVAPGMLETAVRDQADRPIALTLLRSTRRTVFTDGEPGGLLLGDALRFRYWVLPLAGEPEPARLSGLGQQLAGGLRAVQLRPADLAALEGPALPAEAGFLELEGPLVLTSAAGAAGGLELRLFNPQAGDAAGVLRAPAVYRTAQPVNLEGEPVGPPAPVVDGELPLRLGPKQIQTLRLER